jgi:protein phosphatase 1 regulatory subunit 37
LRARGGRALFTLADTIPSEAIFTKQISISIVIAFSRPRRQEQSSSNSSSSSRGSMPFVLRKVQWTAPASTSSIAIAIFTQKSFRTLVLRVLRKVQCGSIDVPDGSIDVPDGSIDVPDGSIDVPDGSIDVPEGSIDVPDGSIDVPDGSIDVPGLQNQVLRLQCPVHGSK